MKRQISYLFQLSPLFIPVNYTVEWTPVIHGKTGVAYTCELFPSRLSIQSKVQYPLSISASFPKKLYDIEYSQISRVHGYLLQVGDTPLAVHRPRKVSYIAQVSVLFPSMEYVLQMGLLIPISGYGVQVNPNGMYIAISHRDMHAKKKPRHILEGSSDKVRGSRKRKAIRECSDSGRLHKSRKRKSIHEYRNFDIVHKIKKMIQDSGNSVTGNRKRKYVAVQYEELMSALETIATYDSYAVVEARRAESVGKEQQIDVFSTLYPNEVVYATLYHVRRDIANSLVERLDIGNGKEAWSSNIHSLTPVQEWMTIYQAIRSALYNVDTKEKESLNYKVNTGIVRPYGSHKESGVVADASPDNGVGVFSTVSTRREAEGIMLFLSALTLVIEIESVLNRANTVRVLPENVIQNDGTNGISIVGGYEQDCISSQSYSECVIQNNHMPVRLTAPYLENIHLEQGMQRVRDAFLRECRQLTPFVIRVTEKNVGALGSVTIGEVRDLFLCVYRHIDTIIGEHKEGAIYTEVTLERMSDSSTILPVTDKEIERLRAVEKGIANKSDRKKYGILYTTEEVADQLYSMVDGEMDDTPASDPHAVSAIENTQGYGEGVADATDKKQHYGREGVNTGDEKQTQDSTYILTGTEELERAASHISSAIYKRIEQLRPVLRMVMKHGEQWYAVVDGITDDNHSSVLDTVGAVEKTLLYGSSMIEAIEENSEQSFVSFTNAAHQEGAQQGLGIIEAADKNTEHGSIIIEASDKDTEQGISFETGFINQNEYTGTQNVEAAENRTNFMQSLSAQSSMHEVFDFYRRFTGIESEPGQGHTVLHAVTKDDKKLYILLDGVVNNNQTSMQDIVRAVEKVLVRGSGILDAADKKQDQGHGVLDTADEMSMQEGTVCISGGVDEKVRQGHRTVEAIDENTEHGSHTGDGISKNIERGSTEIYGLKNRYNYTALTNTGGIENGAAFMQNLFIPSTLHTIFDFYRGLMGVEENLQRGCNVLMGVSNYLGTTSVIVLDGGSCKEEHAYLYKNALLQYVVSFKINWIDVTKNGANGVVIQREGHVDKLSETEKSFVSATDENNVQAYMNLLVTNSSKANEATVRQYGTLHTDAVFRNGEVQLIYTEINTLRSLVDQVITEDGVLLSLSYYDTVKEKTVEAFASIVSLQLQAHQAAAELLLSIDGFEILINLLKKVITKGLYVDISDSVSNALLSGIDKCSVSKKKVEICDTVVTPVMYGYADTDIDGQISDLMSLDDSTCTLGLLENDTNSKVTLGVSGLGNDSYRTTGANTTVLIEENGDQVTNSQDIDACIAEGKTSNYHQADEGYESCSREAENHEVTLYGELTQDDHSIRNIGQEYVMTNLVSGEAKGGYFGLLQYVSHVIVEMPIHSILHWHEQGNSQEFSEGQYERVKKVVDRLYTGVTNAGFLLVVSVQEKDGVQFSVSTMQDSEKTGAVYSVSSGGKTEQELEGIGTVMPFVLPRDVSDAVKEFGSTGTVDQSKIDVIYHYATNGEIKAALDVVENRSDAGKASRDATVVIDMHLDTSNFTYVMDTVQHSIKEASHDEECTDTVPSNLYTGTNITKLSAIQEDAQKIIPVTGIFDGTKEELTHAEKEKVNTLYENSIGNMNHTSKGFGLVKDIDSATLLPAPEMIVQKEDMAKRDTDIVPAVELVIPYTVQSSEHGVAYNQCEDMNKQGVYGDGINTQNEAGLRADVLDAVQYGIQDMEIGESCINGEGTRYVAAQVTDVEGVEEGGVEKASLHQIDDGIGKVNEVAHYTTVHSDIMQEIEEMNKQTVIGETVCAESQSASSTATHDVQESRPDTGGVSEGAISGITVSLVDDKVTSTPHTTIENSGATGTTQNTTDSYQTKLGSSGKVADITTHTGENLQGDVQIKSDVLLNQTRKVCSGQEQGEFVTEEKASDQSVIDALSKADEAMKTSGVLESWLSSGVMNSEVIAVEAIEHNVQRQVEKSIIEAIQTQEYEQCSRLLVDTIFKRESSATRLYVEAEQQGHELAIVVCMDGRTSEDTGEMYPSIVTMQEFELSQAELGYNKIKIWFMDEGKSHDDEPEPQEKKRIWLIMGKPNFWNGWNWKKTR